MTAKSAVAASSVVLLEPRRKGGAAVGVGGVGAAVSPLCCEGAVESFDFAVLPGAVGSDEFLRDAVLGSHRPQ